MTRNQIVFLSCMAILVLAALVAFAAFYTNRPVEISGAQQTDAARAQIYATSTAIQQQINNGNATSQTILVTITARAKARNK